MEEQVKIFCRFCRTLIAIFDDFAHILQQEETLMFFKKVCNMEVLAPAEFVLYSKRKLMGSLYCKGCRCCRGVGPLEFDEIGANGNNDEDDKVYVLMLYQIIMMRGDKQIEVCSFEAATLFEEGCKRYELAEEKGKSSEAVNELGAFDKIHSEYMKAVKRFVNIGRIRESLGNGESAKAVAKLGARFDKQIQSMQLQLTAIDMEIEKVQSLTETELENNSEEVTKSIKGMEKKIRIIASLIRGFEEELVANIDRGQASDAPEKAPKESGMGEGTSSKAITELGSFENIDSEYTEVVKRLSIILIVIRMSVGNGESSEAVAELGARFEREVPRMLFKLTDIDTEIKKVRSSASTEMEPGKSSRKVTQALQRIQRKITDITSQIRGFEEELAPDIDRRQDSEAHKKGPEKSGTAIETKTGSFRAETGEETSSKAVNELGPFKKINSEFTEVVKRLIRIIVGIVSSLENGEGSEVAAELGARFEREVPQIQLKLNAIDAEIEKVRSSASTEMEPGKSSQKVTQALQRIQRKITVIASQIGRLEEDLAADIERRQASDAPETAPEESGAAIDKKTGGSRAAMGKEARSEAVNELGPFEKIHSEYTEAVKRLKSITIGIRTSIENGEGSEAAAELGARFDSEIPHMQLKLTDIQAEIKRVHSIASTEKEPGKSSQNVTQALERIKKKITIIASLIGGFEEELAAHIDRRQASNAPETAPEESGATIEKKTGSSRAAMGKGTSSEALNEPGPFEKIHSEYTEAVKRLLNIISLRASLGNGEGSEAVVADLVEHLDSQIPHMELKLTDIDVEIEKVRSRALTETELENSWEEVTQAIERLERKIRVVVSQMGRFEEDLVADVVKRHASDAPEKAPKESGTAIEEKTSSSRAATGEETSSKTITEQATIIKQQFQYMGSELADTETEPANLDTRQTSDELGKEAGDSGTAIEEKTSSSGAVSQKKSQGKKRKERRNRRRSLLQTQSYLDK